MLNNITMDYNIDDVYESFIKKYGNFGYTKEQLKHIIGGPFRMLKHSMSSDEFNEIRFTYFGVFKPIKSKLNERKDNTV